MQQLHLVGFTTDHKGLILGTRRGTEEGSFVVNLDRTMIEQIEQLLRLQAGESGEFSGTGANGVSPLLRRAKAESRLTPREVQAMLRTGHSVSEVAEAAGMSEDWVGRFAPPILAEQARVIERATGLTYSKPRIGPSIQPLGESVSWNLAERGIVLSGIAVDDAWTAFQQGDGGWVVRISYLAERRLQHADWTIDMSQGVLKAVNRLGNELAYVEAGRRRPTALPPATPASASAQRAAAAPVKPPSPPPLPPRPSGRLSLLSTGSGVGGGGRQLPTARIEPRDRPGISRSAPPPSPGSGRSIRDMDRSGGPPPAPTRPTPVTPAKAARPSATPASSVPPAERRPRPLRPLRPRGAPEPKPSAVTPEASPPPPRRNDAGPPAAPTEPRPRRERPLRAPSRIRRDELADAAPPPRRPVLPPTNPSTRRGPAVPPVSGEPKAERPGRPQPAGERQPSATERLRSGRPAGQGSRRLPRDTPGTDSTASALALAVADPPETTRAGPVDTTGSSWDRRSTAGESLEERRRGRWVAGATAPDEEADETPDELGPSPDREVSRPLSSSQPDASQVYRAFAELKAAELKAEDPITAPVPEVNIVDQGNEFDHVLIRTRQAGASDPGAEKPSTPARREAEDRQARSGRLKLRRRPQAST